MKNQKKQKNTNWESESYPKKEGKKLGYGVYNDMHDKKAKNKIKKKPKYKNDWFKSDDE
jgi:hypothetical protein